MNKQTEQDEVFFIINGKEYCNEELALSILLKDDVIFSNHRFYSMTKDGISDGKTTVLFVNCNDIFAWACADGEDLPHSEIGNLYKMRKSVPGNWGSAKWCCIRRNEKPQRPVQEMMKKSGAWDETLEKLPENQYDKFIQSRRDENNSKTDN